MLLIISPEVGDDSSEMSILGLFSTKVVPSRRRLVLQNDSDLLKEMKNWMSSYVVEEHRLKEECERCGKCEGLDAVRNPLCTGKDTCLCPDCREKLLED